LRLLRPVLERGVLIRLSEKGTSGEVPINRPQRNLGQIV
jgi:hypothetical protein